MQRLAPRGSGIGLALFLTLFALFWNGILLTVVSGMLLPLGDEGGLGDGLTGLLITVGIGLFLLPFLLVGLALVGAIYFAFRPTLGILPELEISSGRARPGETLALRLLPARGAGWARLIAWRLRGQEEVETRIGTRTRTDIHVFHDTQIGEAEGSQRRQIWEGAVTVPPDARPSLMSGQHRIVWLIRVEARLPVGRFSNDYVIEIA